MVDVHDEAKDTITQLQHPIDDLQTLLSLLTTPLDALGILPPQFHKYNIRPLPSNPIIIRKHAPLIQRALLEHVLPTWDTALKDNDPNALHLITQYFCPDPFVSSLPVSGELALKAYETILTSQIGYHAVNLLERLAHQYPVDSLWTIIFSQGRDSVVKNVLWEDCVKDVVSVPAKVANAMGGHSDIPFKLESGTYINGVCRRVEVLVERFSRRPGQGGCLNCIRAFLWTTSTSDWVNSVCYLVSKLVNIGAFPPSPPTMRSLPSFWETNLPIIRQKILGLPEPNPYCDAWQKLILDIPSSLALHNVLTSILASLEHVDPPTDSSTKKRVQIKLEAKLLTAVLGRLSEDDNQLWEIATSLILKRDWEESYARIFVCWLADPWSSQRINTEGMS
jgi:telomere length regulation protein